MSGITRSSEGLDPRRRKLLFRSWHRGMREMDLILGSFADACIDGLNEVQLDQYEQLLDISDAVLLAWVTGRKPAADAPSILRSIIEFRDSSTP
ncbi:MAG: succinate dehydrogenase assembly factor 2 [Rhizobiaceae bacterium]|nr:succinate dehydrogenase assembly factor 2 [Rhizobiaceae bacterium]MCV0406380.1 succinate dehydrogenase assembly factor 2 [Rhizobiaceae bacterium]